IENASVLFWLEPGIVRRDAVRSAQIAFEKGRSVRIDFATAAIGNGALAVGLVFEFFRILHSYPFANRCLRVTSAKFAADVWAFLGSPCPTYHRRRHQIPAHKRDRGGVAKLHSTFS